MDPNTFDRLTQLLATRATRRAAALGAAGSMALVSGTRVLAQDATPGGGTPAATGEIDVLYVQTFASGEIVDTGDGSFTLSLVGSTGQTVFFSNHPERLAGALTTSSFLDGEAFDPTDPPNAALVAEGSNGQTIAVVELLDPMCDGASMTVNYTARPISGDLSAAMSSFQALSGELTAGTLGPASMFVDGLMCEPPGGVCRHNSDCCSGDCCMDIEHCPPWACL